MFDDLQRMDVQAWASHLPVVTIYRTGDDGLVSDPRVYADLAPVFAAPPEPAGAATAECDGQLI